ncbi:MAG TPA: alpha/beta fold hydrolase [Myxococcaceae bacterium]|jgi:hypothetical protein
MSTGKKVLIGIAGVLALLFILAVIAIGALYSTVKPMELVDGPGEPFMRRRELKGPNLVIEGPSHQPHEVSEVPPEVTAVRYESAGRMLPAWLHVPPTEPGKRLPALVYLHGGFAFGASDYFDMKPFVDAGYIVLVPSWRGENGNPGHFELMFGELDDAVAAVKFLAARDDVDTQRIFALGHSAGGGVASLLSLVPDVPLALTSSIGGLYPEEVFFNWSDIAPFNIRDRESRRLRVLHPHLRQMQRPHIAYVGRDDMVHEFSHTLAKALPPEAHKLRVISVEGDHFTSVPAGVNAFLDVTRAFTP